MCSLRKTRADNSTELRQYERDSHSGSVLRNCATLRQWSSAATRWTESSLPSCARCVPAHVGLLLHRLDAARRLALDVYWHGYQRRAALQAAERNYAYAVLCVVAAVCVGLLACLETAARESAGTQLVQTTDCNLVKISRLAFWTGSNYCNISVAVQSLLRLVEQQTRHRSWPQFF